MRRYDQLEDEEIERYGRQLLLPEFREGEQLRLLNSRAVLIGVGGLGGPAALHLAGSGLGALRLVDSDRVALDNLHRQVAFRTADIGEPKTKVICRAIQALNSQVSVEEHRGPLNADNIDSLLLGADVVLECSDGPETKFLVNDWCVRHRLPLVIGGAIGWRGQLTVVSPGGPCYRCLFKAPSDEMLRSCREAGVIGPLVGVIGSLQALEAIRLVLWPERFKNRLLDFDGESGRWRTISLERDDRCPVHGE